MNDNIKGLIAMAVIIMAPVLLGVWTIQSIGSYYGYDIRPQAFGHVIITKK